MSDMDKGTTFGGILHWPRHPAADMHGLVRAVVRVRSRVQVGHAVTVYGLPWTAPSMWLQGIWGESLSQAEREATRAHYGQLLVCRLEEQYLHAELYREPPKDLEGKKKG